MFRKLLSSAQKRGAALSKANKLNHQVKRFFWEDPFNPLDTSNFTNPLSPFNIVGTGIFDEPQGKQKPQSESNNGPNPFFIGSLIAGGSYMFAKSLNERNHHKRYQVRLEEDAPKPISRRPS